MSNVIAIVWDFDKTLIPGYMQDPIFRKYGVDPKEFWDETNALPQEYAKKQGILVNEDTIYLNQFIRYAQDGRFAGLNNESLKNFGSQLEFFPGVEQMFQDTKAAINDSEKYREYGIQLEHYIVSTGIKKIIEGSLAAKYVERIWGCEFIEARDVNGKPIISEVAYTIDNTTKTRALFEINKGVGFVDGVQVNTKVPEEHRRVHFVNMIYAADGPSDIPAFSVVNKNKGATFAVYPEGDYTAFHQVDVMQKEGRVNMYAAANYEKGKTAYMWLMNQITCIADRIVEEQKQLISNNVGKELPKHLTQSAQK